MKTFMIQEGKAPSLAETTPPKTLQSWLSEAKPSFYERAKRLLLVCKVVSFAHEQGLFSGHLRLEDIRISPTQELFVSGFTEEPPDSPGHQAPELLLQKELRPDEKSDAFLLGVLFYQVLTGQEPFAGKNKAAVMLAVLEKEPTPPSKVVPDCPLVLEALCLRLLSKKSEARPNVPEAIEALSRYLSDPNEALASTVESPSTPSTSTPPPFFDLPMVERSHYEIGGELARGGLGKILVATDRRLGRPVALKELLKDQPQIRARFLQEAFLTAKLQHPGVVPIHEAGRWSDGSLFYAMKLIEGRPLSEVLKEKHTLEERLSLLSPMISIAETIAYAHSKHIIHRDLKPQNILLGEFGETVVIDWGFAKELAVHRKSAPGKEGASHLPAAAPTPNPLFLDLTPEGSIIGTPAYMPPEQAQGKAVDERADVFSLGAILYHLLAGEPPYQGKSSREILSLATKGEPLSLAQREGRLPKDLVAIVTKAMEKDPAARYATAAQLAQDLKSFQTGKLVEAYQYAWWEHLYRWTSQNKTASIALLIALCALVWALTR